MKTYILGALIGIVFVLTAQIINQGWTAHNDERFCGFARIAFSDSIPYVWWNKCPETKSLSDIGPISLTPAKSDYVQVQIRRQGTTTPSKERIGNKICLNFDGLASTSDNGKYPWQKTHCDISYPVGFFND